jgi:hypothetical protein
VKVLAAVIGAGRAGSPSTLWFGLPERSTRAMTMSAVSISADLGDGPGHPGGCYLLGLLRPFARLISKAGDSVATYGEPWNIN